MATPDRNPRLLRRRGAAAGTAPGRYSTDAGPQRPQFRRRKAKVPDRSADHSEMAEERRNLYRILHVQPEAPAEIIAAAYRCLMTKLRHHPDLGGDHETAVRINQAYAVLSDPAQREAYDESRRRRQQPPSARGGRSARSQQATRPMHACPFCGLAVPRQVRTGTCCQQCDSPLAPIAYNFRATRELFGRRSAPRVEKNCRATVRTSPSATPAAATLRDLSLTGISLLTEADVRAGCTIRIEAPVVIAVAHVIKVQARQGATLVRACLLTALYSDRSGVFVSETA